MRIRTAEQYADRYRRIGQRRTRRPTLSDLTCTITFEHRHPWDLAYRSKPGHAARAVGLPLIALGARPRPKQVEHPATTPIEEWHRRANYAQQAGHNDPQRLTPRQRRRVDHKHNHAYFGYELAETAAEQMTDEEVDAL